MELKPSLIPTEVRRVTDELERAGYEAYIVGGCVRDLLIGRKPKDWDVTTNATPEDIQKLFEETYYTNEFGTVGLVNAAVSDESLKIVEVTPYRLEGRYSDARRPDEVIFSQHIEDDLKRRDFTINALAYSPSKGQLIDLFEGIKDLDARVLRAVGDPNERFEEDAQRPLRAVRLAAEMGLAIEAKTEEAMAKWAGQLGKISKERIQIEFVRILNTDKPKDALELAQKLGLLRFIAPELEEGIGIDQNQAHKYDVFEHNLRALQHAADKSWPFSVRIAALYHDVGKPRTRRRDEAKGDWTFHGHDVVGARMTKKALEGLKFPRETIEQTVNLVRWHMFFSDPDKITLSAVRRIIRNVGPEHIEELINLRICDRIGTGRPKEQPFRLRKYQAMIDEALRDPISVGMLKIDGKRLMDVTRETPGPKIGWTLHALLEEVLDDPAKNTEEYLENRAGELLKLPADELRRLGEAGKDKKTEADEAELKDIRKKHFVD
ncbi:MAG TPA: CCA tRNA nucleotidyltransferase [Candidatus Paceibacterota bacterium]|jgi:poly(A) polymerase/tRNA nucleotidyltransferase (CCA-adding enzyme)|nr:CCA tRNA nucleotidyltransferase [Candidatus Paceibacterota bacterium]